MEDKVDLETKLKKSFLKYIFVVSLLLTASLSHAGMLSSQAGSFMRMGLGADRIAMGDAGVALTQSAMNWYYNPAALPYLERRTVSLDYRSLALDRSIMYAGYSMSLSPDSRKRIKQDGRPMMQNKAGIAIGILRAGVDNVDGRDSNGEKYETFSWADNVIHGSFALQPNKWVSAGLTIKWMINQVPKVLEDDKTLYGYGIAVDLGVRVQAMENLAFGLQVRDIDGKYKWDTSEVWADENSEEVNHFPTQIRLGGAWNPLENLTTVLDLVVYSQYLADDGDAIRVHGGGEWIHRINQDREFALRAGFNGHAPTAGFGFNFDIPYMRLGLNYAFVLEQESPDPAHMFTWNIGF